MLESQIRSFGLINSLQPSQIVGIRRYSLVFVEVAIDHVIIKAI